LPKQNFVKDDSIASQASSSGMLEGASLSVRHKRELSSQQNPETSAQMNFPGASDSAQSGTMLEATILES